MTNADYRSLLKILVWNRPLIRVLAFPVRMGIQNALRVDLDEISSRLAVSYLSVEQAALLCFDQDACQQLRAIRSWLFRTYKQLGGKVNVLESILKLYALTMGEVLVEMSSELDLTKTS